MIEDIEIYSIKIYRKEKDRNMETNAQRITNICYPRGSIIYAQFSKGSEYYFLNMRPLIVISIQNQMFDSLNVIACGSRDRPGVEISLFNHMRGKWIGDHQYSVAQPYAIYTVMVSQIVEFHGVIDPFTMKAIDKAVAFHLGMTDEVPPYMKDIYEELMEPRYSMGTNENTQLNDPHQIGSSNETTRRFENLPKKNPGKVIGKPYPKSTETFTVNSTNFIPEQNNPTIEMEEDIPTKMTKNAPSNPKATKPTDTTEPIMKESTETKVKRIGTATLIIPNQNGMIPVSDTILNIVASLTDEDKVKVITRKMEPGNYGINGSIQVYANQISQIRRGVEYIHIYNGGFSKKMKDRICKRQSNFRFLSNFEKACCILYCSPEELGITDAIYTDVAKQVMKEYHLQFEDGRAWRGLPMLDKLKKIYMASKKH